MDRAKEWNDRRSMTCTAKLVESYFSGEDLFLTFGYLPEQRPRNREAARWYLKSEVIDPLRRLRKAQGVPCWYAYSLSMADDNSTAEHSLILSRGQETPELLKSIWTHGPVVCCSLRDMGDVSALVRRMYTTGAKDAPKGYKPITHARRMVYGLEPV